MYLVQHIREKKIRAHFTVTLQVKVFNILIYLLLVHADRKSKKSWTREEVPRIPFVDEISNCTLPFVYRWNPKTECNAAFRLAISIGADS